MVGVNVQVMLIIKKAIELTMRLRIKSTYLRLSSHSQQHICEKKKKKNLDNLKCSHAMAQNGTQNLKIISFKSWGIYVQEIP